MIKIAFIALALSLSLQAFAQLEDSTKIDTIILNLDSDNKAAVADALTSIKAYLVTNKIEFAETTKEGFAVLEILPTGKSKINVFAKQVQEKLNGLKILINPAQLAARTGSKGFYDTDDHTISVARQLSQILALKDSTFFHELKHAFLSKRTYLEGQESLYGLVVAKRNVTMMDMFTNPYAKLMTMQEFSTHAYQLNILNSQYNKAVTSEEKSRIAIEMEKTILVAAMVSANLKNVIADFAADLNTGTVEVSEDAQKFGGGISKHFILKNSQYDIYVALAPGTNLEQAKQKLKTQFADYAKFVSNYSDAAENAAIAIDSKDLSAMKEKIAALSAIAQDASTRALQCKKMF